MDVPWKDYVDAQDEKTRALNDARFAELGARIDTLAGKIDGLGDRISQIKDPPSIWQIVGIAATAVIALITILGIMADRFDGGIAASGLLDQMRAEQAERDATQDARFGEIIERLDALAAE